MNKIRILGLTFLIIGGLGLHYTNGYGFIFGILAGIGIVWILTGEFILMSKN
ncbi:hypothetical protein ML462_15335 [Gramella lutea]|uniref:Uncharacterized protein n=1 Tax=Christiangramia lutea TaxID=1607951 RepID=A0A9X2AAI7_9FLAO|nr:hypothetical protein [Christiangramia lutea]MCH4824545.1 hypothetical protein [Christiangramia lutea]